MGRNLEQLGLAFPVGRCGIVEQMFLRGHGALVVLFRDSHDVVVIVAFKTILNVMVNNVLDARAMLGAKTVCRWVNGVPGYHYLGGRGVENAFLAPDGGAEMLMRIGRRKEGECS